MLKKLLKISLIVSLPILAISCGGEDNSSKTDATPTEEVDSTTTSENTEEEPAATEEVTPDSTEASTSEGATYEEGSWAYSLQEFLNSDEAGEKTFSLDQISLSDDDSEDQEFSAEGDKQLDELASLLRSYPNVKAEVQGHSKEGKNVVGKKAKKSWSKVKAFVVRKKLISRGVSEDQLRHEGYGDEFLLEGVDGQDDSQNRIMVKISK